MIVKDEAHVIRRCLASVKPFIDYWVIVDTGSTDGTQEIIKDYLKDVRGELHECTWINFAHNRNEALALARGKGDYLLNIDADDKIVASPHFSLPDLDKDAYYILQKVKGEGKTETYNQALFLYKNIPEFTWIGAVHEVLSCTRKPNAVFLQEIINEYHHDGARSKDPKRHEKDVQMLEEELREDPHNSRSVFYLAQTFRGNADFSQALKYYKQRAVMGGREDEVFCSLYYIAMIEKCLKAPAEVVQRSFMKAYCSRPTRAEPLFQMSVYLLEKDHPWLAYLLANYALQLKIPKDDLFVDSWIYEWGLQSQLSQCAKKLSA